MDKKTLRKIKTMYQGLRAYQTQLGDEFELTSAEWQAWATATDERVEKLTRKFGRRFVDRHNDNVPWQLDNLVELDQMRPNKRRPVKQFNPVYDEDDTTYTILSLSEWLSEIRQSNG